MEESKWGQIIFTKAGSGKGWGVRRDMGTRKVRSQDQLALENRRLNTDH